MNWLATLLAKMFREVLDWGQKNAEKPGEMKDAETPKDIKRRIDDDVARRLRDKAGRGGEPG